VLWAAERGLVNKSEHPNVKGRERAEKKSTPQEKRFLTLLQGDREGGQTTRKIKNQIGRKVY